MTVRYVPRRFHAAIPGRLETIMADHTQNLMALTRSVAEAAHLGTEGLIMNAGVLLAEHFDARIQAEETAGRQHA